MIGIAIRLILLALLSTAAQAGERVALVIGSSNYRYTPTLTNPRNDAADVAGALRKLGFKVVEGLDLNKAEMERSIRDFASALRGAEAGLFFYAGHGLQVSGRNYLVPVDAQLTAESALDFEMVRLDLVQRTMEREAQTNILLVDACRDNPLARNLARAMGTRSSQIRRGLAAVESGVGTLISFSTQPDNVALDGSGRNSPYSGALVKHLNMSTDDLSALLIAVRNDVLRETDRQQVPWEHSALTGRFYFRPASIGGAARERDIADRSEWAIALGADRLASYRAYVRGRPDGMFVAEANRRIAHLEHLAARWDELKASRDLVGLKAFAEEAKQTEFGAWSADRLKELASQETAAWQVVAARQRLQLYENFIANWRDGFFAEQAKDKIEELRAIRAQWNTLKVSGSEQDLESFILKYGWSEYGAEATAQLVSLRRERAVPDSSLVRTLTAGEMLRAIDGVALTLQDSGEVIRFATKPRPGWKTNLSKDFLRQLIKEDLEAEGSFTAETSTANDGATIIGIGGIVRSRVDRTGSLFLLQLHGGERTRKDVDAKDRQFKTVQIVQDAFGYVCIATSWHSILADSKPTKGSYRCDFRSR